MGASNTVDARAMIREGASVRVHRPSDPAVHEAVGFVTGRPSEDVVEVTFRFVDPEAGRGIDDVQLFDVENEIASVFC